VIPDIGELSQNKVTPAADHIQYVVQKYGNFFLFNCADIFSKQKVIFPFLLKLTLGGFSSNPIFLVGLQIAHSISSKWDFSVLVMKLFN